MATVKLQGLTLVLVVLLIVSGVGIVALYWNNQTAANAKGELTAKVEMSEALSGIESRAWGELAKAEDNLTKASLALSGTGMNTSGARAVLQGLVDNVTYSVDAVTIDTNGIILAAVPTSYSGSEGADISQQPQVQRMLETRMPVTSDVFTMVEGFEATDMEVPVFTADGQFNGSVSVTINLQQMLKDIVNVELDTSTYQFTCLQTDGREIYDTDEAQIGRNLFTDPVYQNYTETLAFMRLVVQEPQGYGTYQYYSSLSSGQLVDKEVYWTSFGLNGAEWRLLVIHVQ